MRPNQEKAGEQGTCDPHGTAGMGQRNGVAPGYSIRVLSRPRSIAEQHDIQHHHPGQRGRIDQDRQQADTISDQENGDDDELDIDDQKLGAASPVAREDLAEAGEQRRQ